MTDINNLFMNAPEGATHWDICGEVFCDIDGFWFGDGEYMEITHDLWGTDNYIPRPTINQQLTVPVVKEKFTTEEVVCSKTETTTWGGEGYPPIGTICEMYIDEIDDWVQGEVIAIHKGYIHIWNDKAESGCFTDDLATLRPIKSNRDKWIESVIENKEELYRQLGYRYDTIYDPI